MPSVATPSKKKSLFDGNKMWFVFAVIASVVAAGLAFTLMRIVTATETYYVLAQDVPARAEITPTMLEPVTTRLGGAPPNALNPASLGEAAFSLYALEAGDILTQSNIGDLTPLSQGLPDDFVIASFTVDPAMAAAGNVRRGDYIDIMAILQDPTITGTAGYAASYTLQHVLVLDATVSLEGGDSTGSTSTDPAGEEVNQDVASRTGAPTMYTVGLSQADAAALAVAMQYELYIVLSSQDAVAGNVATDPGQSDATTIWGSAAPDAGVGTDSTFGRGEAVNPNTDTDSGNEPSTPEETEEVETPSSPEAPSTPETTEGEEPAAP